MKLLLLFATLSFAADARECVEFRLRGQVIVDQSEFYLQVRPGTQSQRRFGVVRAEEHKLAPLGLQFVEGEFLLEDADLSGGAQLLQVKSIQRAVPDPLNPEKDLIRGKKVSCPKPPAK
jgi:hypothetical protein